MRLEKFCNNHNQDNKFIDNELYSFCGKDNQL